MVFVHINSDTRPTYRFRLKRGGQAVNLTGSTVVLLFRKADGTTVVTKSCTIVDAAAGIISFSFAASDVNQNGYSCGEIKVTFQDGGIQHGRWRIDWYVRAEYEETPDGLGS